MASGVTLCGSLSRYPVGLGRAMHEAGYRALNLPFVYVPFATEDLPGALAGMRALGIRGFGISMPFKLEIMPLLDELDALACQIGAVNTVVNEDGVLRGYNTDADGALRALREVRDVAGRSVVVVGAGGAARAVVYALANAGARVRVVNRTEDKARALAEQVGANVPQAVTWARLGPAAFEGAEILVQATSATMSDLGARSPIPDSALTPDTIVMDIVYKPVRTVLIEAAERRGLQTVDGSRMLLHQACRQFELYTGGPAPLEAMDAALREQLR
ncbi:MAG: shikimate dehydrogenase [Polyangiaceae bacterium]